MLIRIKISYKCVNLWDNAVEPSVTVRVVHGLYTMAVSMVLRPSPAA
jgi:hypothetical protein